MPQCSPVRPVPHVQQKRPGGAAQEAEKARTEDAALRLGGCRGEPMGAAAAPECSREPRWRCRAPRSRECSHATDGGRGENAGDEFSGRNIFPSIRRCPSAIARTQVREGDGICDSLPSQYLCLKRVVDLAMNLGVV